MFFKKMKKNKMIKERGPGPLRMSIYIIITLFVVAGFFLYWSDWDSKRKVKIIITIKHHMETVNYIQEEIFKCSNDESNIIMKGYLSCSEMTATKVVESTHKTFNRPALSQFNPYLRPAEIKTLRISTNNNTDEDVGYVNLSASGSDVVVKSCYKKPCSNENNRRSDTIEIE